MAQYNLRPSKHVLETIKRICDFSDIDISIYDKEIKLGLEFYKKYQFNDDGVSIWRLPKKWPVDIHNQSQGIITFSIFKSVMMQLNHLFGQFKDSYSSYST